MLYDLYFLLDAVKGGLQRVLMILILLTYSSVVFSAGYKSWKNRKDWMPITLIAQALQIYPLSTSNLYVSLRCGISYDFFPAKGIFDINLLDLNSAFSWRKAPDFYAGFNIFALFMCMLLLVIWLNQSKRSEVPQSEI